MAITLGELIIKLSAKTDAFAKGLTDAKQFTFTSVDGMVASFEKLGSSISKLKFDNDKQIQASLKLIGGLAAGVTTAVAAAGAVLVEKSLKSAAAFEVQSQKVGLSVETLSALVYVAKQSGISQEALEKGTIKLSKSMYDAATGNKEAQRAYKSLGVTVTDTTGRLRPTADVLRDVAAKLSRLEDGAYKTATAQKIFGKSGADLLPAMNEGATGIAALTDEAQKLGVVLDSETAKAAKRVEDNIERLSASVQGLGYKLLKETLPALEKVTSALANPTLQDTGKFDFLSKAIGGIANAFVTAFGVMQSFFDSVGVYIKQLSAQILILLEGIASAQFAGSISGAIAILRKTGTQMADIARLSNAEVASIWKETYDGIKQLWSKSPIQGNKEAGEKPPALGDPEAAAKLAAKLDAIGNQLTAIGDKAKLALAKFTDPFSAAAEKATQELAKIQKALGEAAAAFGLKDTRSLFALAASNQSALKIVTLAREAMSAVVKVRNKEIADADEKLVEDEKEIFKKLAEKAKDFPIKLTIPTPSAIPGFNLGAYQNAALKAGEIEKKLNQLDYTQGIKRAFDELEIRMGGALGGARAFFRQYAEYAKQTGQQVFDALANAFSQLEDTLADFFTTFKANWAALAQSIEKEIVKIAIRGLITGPIAGLFSKLFGAPLGSKSNPIYTRNADAPSVPAGVDPNSGNGSNPAGTVQSTLNGLFSKIWASISGIFKNLGSILTKVFSSIGSFFGGIFGGGRAAGGPVSAGTMYQVNEGKHIEYFKPNVGGHIIPLGQMAAAGGGFTYAPTYYITTPDADSFRKSPSQVMNQGLDAALRARGRK